MVSRLTERERERRRRSAQRGPLALPAPEQEHLTASSAGNAEAWPVLEATLEEPEESLADDALSSDALSSDEEAARRGEEESFEALLAEQDYAASTRNAYLADWRDFCDWCAEERSAGRSAEPLPCTERTLFRYLTARALRLKIGTLRRRQAAIRLAHRLAGFTVLASPEEPTREASEMPPGATGGALVAQRSSIEELVDQARRYSERSAAASTIKAYQLDWEDFERFCEERSLAALPTSPHYVALYLTDRAELLKVATLQRRLTSIRQMHRLSGHQLDTKHPAISKVWGGIRRTHGVAQVGKAALRIEELRLIAANLPESLSGVRDRALLLLGFAGAFRRAELVSLNIEDLQLMEGRGLLLHLRRSKTDQEGRGFRKAIPYGRRPQTCPVKSLLRWLELSGLEGQSGPLFRPFTRNKRPRTSRLSAHAVARILKRSLREALTAQGWPRERIEGRIASISGHSLRAGFVTSSAAEGVQEHVIMRQTGHKRIETLRRYIREEDLFQDNPFAALGL